MLGLRDDDGELVRWGFAPEAVADACLRTPISGARCSFVLEIDRFTPVGCVRGNA
jgi:hypothetical protein